MYAIARVMSRSVEVDYVMSVGGRTRTVICGRRGRFLRFADPDEAEAIAVRAVRRTPRWTHGKAITYRIVKV
jgi:hypothetical protein